MRKSGPPIKVLIADDVLLVRRLLVRDLTREPDLEVIGEAADGMEAVELARRLSPDVVLMDLEMPHLNGIQAMEQIRAASRSTRFVLLTGHEQLAALGALAGAAQCLDKGCTPEALLAAIRTAHEVPSPADPLDEPDLGAALQRIALRAGLTDRERSVMERVVLEDLTAAQIARALTLDGARPVSESSVKHALERVMSKLCVEPRTRATLVRHVLELARTE